MEALRGMARWWTRSDPGRLPRGGDVWSGCEKCVVFQRIKAELTCHLQVDSLPSALSDPLHCSILPSHCRLEVTKRNQPSVTLACPCPPEPQAPRPLRHCGDCVTGEAQCDPQGRPCRETETKGNSGAGLVLNDQPHTAG